jgi:hypothetical protein
MAFIYLSLEAMMRARLEGEVKPKVAHLDVAPGTGWMDTFVELAAAEEVPRRSIYNYQQLLPFPALFPASRTDTLNTLC